MKLWNLFLFIYGDGNFGADITLQASSYISCALPLNVYLFNKIYIY